MVAGSHQQPFSQRYISRSTDGAEAMSPIQLPYSQDEMDLQQLLEVAHRRRWMLAGVAIATTVCLWGWTLTRTPIYRGEFQVLVESIAEVDPSQELLSDNQIQLRSNFDYDTQIEVLQSPALLRPIAEELRDTFPEFTYSELKGNLTITRLRETKVLSVSYRDPDPEKIQAVLDVVAEHYLQYSFEQRQTSLQQGVQFVETQLPELRDRVNSLQQRLERFRQDYSLIDPESRGIEISQLITSIEDQQQNTQTQLSEAESLYRAIQSQLGYSPDQALAASALSESNRYQAILNEIQEVEAQIATESARFLPDTPNVQILNDRRESLLPLLDQEAERILGPQLSSQLNGNLTSISIDLSRQLINTANEVQVLQARERALAEVEQQLKQEFDLVPALARQYTDLQRELDIATNSLNRFLTTRESLQIEAAQQSIPWQLIAEPTAVNSPISPNVPRSLMLGAIAGVLLGAGAAFVTDKLDMVFHTPDDLKTFTRLPMLGIVPFIQDPNLLSANSDEDAPNTVQNEDDAAIYAENTERDRHAYHYKSSPFLESFRSLYANVRFLAADNAIRSVVISSAVPAEGKSTIALNLARAAAIMGQRVLLVDADLRLPQVHERLRLANLRGLSNVIAGEAELQASIQSSGIHDNLFVLTAGRIPPDPIQLLSSQKMQHIIEAAHQDFDLVLYDMPPLLGFADSSILSAQTDGMILTVGLGTTSRTELKQALDTLEVSPVCLLGVVANGIKEHTTHSYGYSHYRYNHYYSYYSGNDRQPKTWFQTMRDTMRDRIQTALPAKIADEPDRATMPTDAPDAPELSISAVAPSTESGDRTGGTSPHFNGTHTTQPVDEPSVPRLGEEEPERLKDDESDRLSSAGDDAYTIISEADLNDIDPDYWDDADELDSVRVPSFEELLDDAPINTTAMGSDSSDRHDGFFDATDDVSEFSHDQLPDLSPSLDSDESSIYHVSISSDAEQALNDDLSAFDASDESLSASELSIEPIEESLDAAPEAIAEADSDQSSNASQTSAVVNPVDTAIAPETSVDEDAGHPETEEIANRERSLNTDTNSNGSDDSNPESDRPQTILSRTSQQSWLHRIAGMNLQSLLNGDNTQPGTDAIAPNFNPQDAADAHFRDIANTDTVIQDSDQDWLDVPITELDWYEESELPFTPNTHLSATSTDPETTITAGADADSDVVHAALDEAAPLAEKNLTDDATSNFDDSTADTTSQVFNHHDTNASPYPIDELDEPDGLAVVNPITNPFNASDWQSSDWYLSEPIENASRNGVDTANHSQSERPAEPNSAVSSQSVQSSFSVTDNSDHADDSDHTDDSDDAWMANDESRAALEQITSSDVESDSEPEVSATTDSRTSLAEDAVSSTDTRHSDMVTEQSPFLEAVVVAREAIAVGQSANTAQDWLQLADQWQRASELMSRVAEEDENYAIAQRCEELYRNNSDYARNRGLA